jgi:hypothetical protein
MYKPNQTKTNQINKEQLLADHCIKQTQLKKQGTIQDDPWTNQSIQTNEEQLMYVQTIPAAGNSIWRAYIQTKPNQASKKSSWLAKYKPNQHIKNKISH